MKKEFFKYNSLYESRVIDVYPTQFGWQYWKTSNNKNIIKDFYALHIILDGKGTFKEHGTSHDLKQGQAFLVRPGQLVSYSVDPSEPWEYIWIGFNGSDVEKLFEQEGIGGNQTVFNLKKIEVFKKILSPLFFKNGSEFFEWQENNLQLQSFCFACLNEFFKQVEKNELEKKNKSVFDEICKYVLLNCDTVLVNTLCEKFAMSRANLFKIFKKKMDISPQQYIMKCKMERARKLIVETDLPFKVIAHSLGYSEYERFSKVYKKYFNLSPSSFRSSHSSSKEINK